MGEETDSLVKEEAVEEPLPKWKQIVGYTCVLAYALGTAISAGCAQALGGIIPMFELNMWRYLSQFGIAGFVFIVSRQQFKTERRHVPWLMITCCSSILFNICFYTSTLYLPLGTVGGMGPSCTLILTFVVTLLLWRKFSLSSTIAIPVCIVGIVLTTQPVFLFPGSKEQNSYTPTCHGRTHGTFQARNSNLEMRPVHWDDTTTFGMSQFGSHNISDSDLDENDERFPEMWKGYLYVLGQAIGQSATYFISNNQLVDLHPMTFAFWLGLEGTAVSLVPMLILEDFVFPQTSECHFLLFGHAFVMGCGVVSGLVGFQLLKPLQNSLVQTVGVLLSFVGQCTVLKDINPGIINAFSIVGSVAIFLGNLIVPVSKLWL